MTVDSVVVIATRRGDYAAADLAEASLWSCGESSRVVVVDGAGSVSPAIGAARVTVLPAVRGGACGFLAAAGVAWCVREGWAAKQYILLDDACLVLRRGLADWALHRIERQGVGLIGVGDRLSYSDVYAKCLPWFDRWDAPHLHFEPGSATLTDAALWLSGAAADAMFRRGLLAPDGAETWPLPYGPYVSWVAQMLGFYQVSWGTLDRRLPPVFAHYTGHGRHQVEPHVLSSQFVLYHSARHCAAYSEEELRSTYRRLRTEPVGSVTLPGRPTVQPAPHP